MSEKLLPPREACRRLGISFITLKRWIYSGKIRAVRTPTGRWLIPESEVDRIVSGEAVEKEVKAVIYARVSNNKQKSDLQKQIQYLTRYCNARGYKIIDILNDIASGLKSNRKGLLRLFNYVVNRQADVVVVTYKDRLTRFGFEYLEYFFRQYGVKIEVVYGKVSKDAYQELVDDLMTIITSFADKLYGAKSNKKKLLVQGFKKLLESIA